MFVCKIIDELLLTQTNQGLFMNLLFAFTYRPNISQRNTVFHHLYLFCSVQVLPIRDHYVLSLLTNLIYSWSHKLFEKGSAHYPKVSGDGQGRAAQCQEMMNQLAHWHGWGESLKVLLLDEELQVINGLWERRLSLGPDPWEVIQSQAVNSKQIYI